MEGNYRGNNFNSKQQTQDGEDGGPKLNEKADEYIRELLSEKIKLHNDKFPLSIKLLDQEVDKTKTTGRVEKNSKYVDVYNETPVKVSTKVMIPVKEFPKFNFVGNLLGMKGSTLKQLQEETMCRMSILGRGSTRDKQKEQELRDSGDPKYAHLHDELHVEISALAPPAEAYARLAYGLAEVKKYLIPDNAAMLGGGPPQGLLPQPGMPPRNPKAMNMHNRGRPPVQPPFNYDNQYAAPPELPRPMTQARRPPPARETNFYEDPEQDRFYEDEPFYQEESNNGNTAGFNNQGRGGVRTARNVGFRRPPSMQQQQQQRSAPYNRPAKYKQ